MSRARNTLELWADETKMALLGIGMVMRKVGYAAIAVVAFLIFAYLLTMFKDGTMTWSLLWSGLSFGSKLGVLGDVWIRVVQNFTDWWGLILMLLAALQGLTISLLIFGWKMKLSSKTTNAGLEAGGVGAAVSFLAVGCPTCGTTLLAPLLTVIAGTGAAALAEVLGWLFVVVAAVLLLHAARRLGYGAYIEITARRHDNAKS